MPRRNNRKHYKHEGELGFNPNKYITGSAYHTNKPKYAVCVSHKSRPAANRHKARACSIKKKRALTQIWEMEQRAERVCLPEDAAPQTTELTLNASRDQEESAISIHSIIGGINHWIRTILSV